MSATASYKVEVEKDRRTRMVTSSVQAPVKKDGAGSHSWGAVGSVTDFLPVGVGGAKVVMGSAPVSPVVASQPLQANVGDASQFPGLSNTVASGAAAGKWSSVPSVIRTAPPAPAPAPAVKVAPAVYSKSRAAPIIVQAGHWPAGAYTAAAAQSALAEYQAATGPQVVLNEDTNRLGTSGMFDATHPRNQFARKPRVSSASGTTVAAEGEVAAQAPAAIDWTTPGTTDAARLAIQAAINPAHLGLYQEAKPMPPMSVLRAIPSVVKDIPHNTNPKQMVGTLPPRYTTPKQNMPMMLQARGR